MHKKTTCVAHLGRFVGREDCLCGSSGETCTDEQLARVFAYGQQVVAHGLEDEVRTLVERVLVGETPAAIRSVVRRGRSLVV